MMLVSFIPSSKVLVTELLCNGCKVTTFFRYSNKNQQKKPKAQNFRLTNTPKPPRPFPLAQERGKGERLESFEVLEAILANFVKSFTHDIRLLNETIPRSVISCLTCLQRY